jgi:hypothetical protein
MSGYLRVSPAGSNVALSWGTGKPNPADSTTKGATASTKK